MFRGYVRLVGLCGAFLVAGIPVLAASHPAPLDLDKAWFQVIGAFAPFDEARFRDRIDELLRLAETLELRRLTPYAQALVLKSRSLSVKDRITVLRQALRLDPTCPEALLELASVSLGRLQPIGLLHAARGFSAFLADGRLKHFRDASLLLLLVLLVAVVGGAWALLTVLQTLPRLWHDFNELAVSGRMGANSWVFAAFLAGLPLFLALDPLWWAFYLFALCWGYWSRPARFGGFLLLVFFLGTPFFVELAQGNFTHTVDPITRGSWALRENRYDPSALLELNEITDLFADEPDFFRLKGDLERQYGALDASLSSYQEGLRQKPQDSALLLSAAIVYYLQGNYGAAVQLFTQSRDQGYDPVVVNYNLSLAFAHVYNFKDSDEAITAARKASERRLRKLTHGRDNKLITPVFTLTEARALLARKDPVMLLNRGLRVPPLSRSQTIFSPLALGSLLAILLALLHRWWRERTLGFAKACSKCGRTFCARCKLSRETQTYCTQCVNIFLKRDMVAPELQIAKQQQLLRRQKLRRLQRRLSDLVLPGLGLIQAGRPLTGSLILFPAALLLLTVGFLLPQVVGPLMLHVNLSPVQRLLLGLWFLLLITAQAQKDGEE